MKKIIITSIILMAMNISHAQWIRTNGPGHTNYLIGNGTILFAAVGGGVFRSTDNGNNWTNTHLATGAYITALALNGNNLYAGANNGIVYRSTDLGNTWILTFQNDELKLHYINFIHVFNNKVFMGMTVSFSTSPTLYASNDSGATWYNSSNGLPGYSAYSMTMHENVLFLAAGAIYSSNDNGLNWSLFGLQDTITFVDYKTNYLFAGSYYNYAFSVYFSTNNGTNWNSLPLTGLSNNIYTLTINEQNRIYAAVNGGNLYYSSDIGNSWINITSGLYGDPLYNIYEMSPYLFTGSTDNNVWRRSLSEITAVQNTQNSIPNKFSLSQNYPNPFNPSTKISYDLPVGGFVNLVIYDVLGREVKTLVNEKQNAGAYEINWDASSNPSGIYLYKLQAGDFTETRKKTLIK